MARRNVLLEMLEDFVVVYGNKVLFKPRTN
jgi:hypothetical protein